jgi:uncharacterized membrane protein
METEWMEKIARWLFVAFVIIAIIMGLIVGYMDYKGDPNVANIDPYIRLVLLILGIAVGLITITTKQVTPYLIAAIALIVASSANVWQPLSTFHPLLYYWAQVILTYIVAFAAPAAVIIAIRSVFAIERS